MRVVFDQQIFLLQRYGGVSRYFIELFLALSKSPEIDVKIIAPLHFNKYLSTLSQNTGFYIPKSTNVFEFNSKLRELSWWLGKKQVSSFSPSIIHETFYSPIFNSPGAKKITTVHDLTREIMGSEINKIDNKKKAINDADGIICVSHNTSKDLMDLYDVPREKMRVIYVGVSDFFKPLTENWKQDYVNQKPFILFVGHRDGYKNCQQLIEAYSQSSFLKKNFSLRFFGGNRLSKNEKVLLSKLGIIDSVEQITGSDYTLLNQYHQASCLVYPSKHEGFGSPIVEALASGCPVFSSNSSALPESGGDAAVYFNPSSIEQLKVTLETTLFDSEKLSSMRALGIQHVKKFRWEETARQTYDFYKSVL